MRSLQDYIRRCTRIQRTLGCMTVVMAAAFYFAGYRPFLAKLDRLTRETQVALVEYKANQARSSVKMQIAARNEKLRQELDRIKKPAKQQELYEVFKDLDRFREQLSLKKVSSTTPALTKSNLYLEQPINLTFEGDFLNVFNYVRSVEQMPRLTRVRSLTLKAREQDDKPGQVQATVQLNTYLSTSDQNDQVQP